MAPTRLHGMTEYACAGYVNKPDIIPDVNKPDIISVLPSGITGQAFPAGRH